MTRGQWLLMLAILVSSLIVVQLRHQSRLQFAELQRLQRDRDAMDTEWGRLLLEEGAWAQNSRIEHLARTRLDMTMPDPAKIVIVDVRKTGP